MPTPKPPIPLEAASFIMEDNPHSVVGVQANETFMLTATNGALGKGGQSVGFAKYQFDGARYNAAKAESEAIATATSSTNRLRNGLENAINDLAAGKDGSSPQVVQEKKEAAVAFLKKKLPEDQRGSISNESNPADVLTTFQAFTANSESKRTDLVSEIAELEKIVSSAADLYPRDAENVPLDRGLLARGVASSQLDQLLGTNIIAEETYGVDKDNNVIGVSIQADGAGVIGSYRAAEGAPKKDCLLQMDLKSPTIQRGLADLEAVDYLTGQIDRHCGNILIDDKGRVSGIDNDLAFPEISREEMFEQGTGFHGKAVAGMPRQMHEDTAKKILSLNPEALRATLSANTTPDGVTPLSQAAIDSACQRLVNLQNEIKRPDGAINIVSEFDDNTYEAAVAAQLQTAEQSLGLPLSAATIEQNKGLEACPKTSYLGSVLVQAKRSEIAIQRNPAENGTRPFASATAAPRDQELAEYANMLESAKKALAANPSSIGQLGSPDGQQQAEAIHEEIAALKDKIAHYDRETAGLDQGRAGSLVRSLASGGTSGRKEFYADKKVEAMQQIADRQRQLEGIAEQAMTPEFKAELRQEAFQIALRANVPTDLAPPPPVIANNNPGQDAVAANPVPFHAPPKDMAPAPPDQDNLSNPPKAAKTKIAAKGDADQTVVPVKEPLPRIDQEAIDKAVEATLKAHPFKPGEVPNYPEVARIAHDRIRTPSQQYKGDTAIIEAQLIDAHEIKPLNDRIEAAEAKITALEQSAPDDPDLQVQKAGLDDLYEELDGWQARVEALKVSMAAENPKNRLAALNAQQKLDNADAALKPGKETELGFAVGTKQHDSNPRQEYELQAGLAIAAKNMIGRVPDAGINADQLEAAITSGYKAAYEYDGPQRLDENGAQVHVKGANDRGIKAPEKQRLAAEIQPVIDKVNAIQTTITPLENANAALYTDIRADIQADPSRIQNPQERQAVQQAQEKLDTASARVDHCEAQLAKLENPGRLDRLKAMTHGGVDKAREHYQAEKTAAIKARSDARGDLNAGLEKAAKSALLATPEGKNLAAQIGELKGEQAKLLQDFHDTQQAFAATMKPERVQGQANKVNAQPVAANDHMDVRSALKKEESHHAPSSLDEGADLDIDSEADVDLSASVATTDPKAAPHKPSVSEALKHPAGDSHVGGHHEAHGGSDLRSTWKPATPSTPAPKTGSSLSHHG